MNEELKSTGVVSIYKVTNNTNGIIYIGQTVQTVNKRWVRHLYDALVKNKPQPFYDAIREFGKESFEVEKIDETVGQIEGDELETLYISTLHATDPSVGYNRMLGGRAGRHTPENKIKIGEKSREWWEDPENKKRASESRKGLLAGERNPMFGKGSFTGLTHTEETKQKISEARVELYQDPDFKRKMSEANTGKHHTEEGKAHIAEALKGNQYRTGIPHDEESKAKISAGLKKAFAEGRRKKTGGLKKGTVLGPMSEEEKQKRSEGMKKAVRTPEHEANRRAALQAYYTRKRAEKDAQKELTNA